MTLSTNPEWSVRSEEEQDTRPTLTLVPGFASFLVDGPATAMRSITGWMREKSGEDVCGFASRADTAAWISKMHHGLCITSAVRRMMKTSLSRTCWSNACKSCPEFSDVFHRGAMNAGQEGSSTLGCETQPAFPHPPPRQ